MSYAMEACLELLGSPGVGAVEPDRSSELGN